MRYAGLIKNDFNAGPGVCVTFFTQGCPHHCPGCHNPETWDFNGGKEVTQEVIDEIIKAINHNGIMRSLAIMGGEPLCDENLFLTDLIIREVKKVYPYIKIYVWTGYEYKNLVNKEDSRLKDILNTINVLIDGPYIKELRDVTLQMRGSSNQNIIELR